MYQICMLRTMNTDEKDQDRPKRKKKREKQYTYGLKAQYC